MEVLLLEIFQEEQVLDIITYGQMPLEITCLKIVVLPLIYQQGFTMLSLQIILDFAPMIQ